MAIYFVSSADGSDGDSGVTLDLAWATLEFALESGGLAAGDSVAIRRTHTETPGSDIVGAYDGTVASPIKIFACPRAAHAISSSDWTNGSTAVVNDDADMSRTEHQSRYITGPDGEKYFITRVVDASNFVIDREYAGSTIINDATASIHADNAQADWTAYDDTADTIKKATWEADSDAVPKIDFNDGDFQLILDTDVCHIFENIEFMDSTDGNGIFRAFRSSSVTLRGCLFKQSAQNDALATFSWCYTLLERCTFEGSGAGSSQVGVYQNGPGDLHLKDVAIYNCGDNGLKCQSNAFLENVNVGVEIANGDDDVRLERSGTIYGRDILLGGTNGLVDFGTTDYPSPRARMSIENYQKVLGTQRVFYLGGYFERVAVSGETPNKKVSDYVMKIVPNVDQSPVVEWAYPIQIHELEMTAAAHTLKYWIYNNSGVTINDGDALANIWLKAEYINSYDDTTEYTITEIFSAEHTIADAADADDWDSLSVTLTPAVAGKVRLTIYLSIYSAAGTLFIDPAVVIS